jgi:hypothetical protein
MNNAESSDVSNYSVKPLHPILKSRSFISPLNQDHAQTGKIRSPTFSSKTRNQTFTCGNQTMSRRKHSITVILKFTESRTGSKSDAGTLTYL